MVELKYVKKRKRRKRVAIGTGICLSGITILGIIAFLGRNTGTFTVALDSGNVSMSLSKSESFENPTSFLRVDGLQHLEQSTYSDQDASELDNENSNGKDFSRCLFKLTFFIKNMAPVEDSAIKYYLNVNMIENHKTTDNEGNDYYLDDILRVRIFENDIGSDRHDSVTYARKSNTILRDNDGNVIKDKDGNDIWQERIPLSYSELNERQTKYPETKENDPAFYYGLAENFLYSEKDTNARIGTVATYKTTDFKPGDIKKYTIVCWLEGEDPDCIGNAGSWNASTLKLGIQINGYENE